MSRFGVLLFALLAGCVGEGTTESTLSSHAATTDVWSNEDTEYVTPPIVVNGHEWSTFAFEPSNAESSEDFDGFVIARRDVERSDDAPPQRFVVVDRRHQLSFVVGLDGEADAEHQERSLATTTSELGTASRELMTLAGGPETSGAKLAWLVDERNRCFLRAAGLVLGALTILKFTPWAARALVSLAAFKDKPLKAVLSTAWASPTVKKALAIKLADYVVEGWILFADAAQPVRDELAHDWNEVTTAKCTLRDYGRPFID